MDAVVVSAHFSSFDMTCGYYQIPVKEKVIPKTAFCSKYGHFEATRMPLGLNAEVAASSAS